ncbi:MFS transporter [Spirillospora sp. NPDC048819]|uniref:MFS transporter n=1 Tax=Spirillospora sp. NPDC048819 TaxID=3155268 RepID=UPI0033D6DF2F
MAALRLTRWRRTKESPSLGPDFTWLTVGSGISQLGSVSTMAAFPLLALSVMDSPVLAGWVTAAGTFPPLLLQLPAGVLIERSDYRLVMVASQVIRVASALMLLAAFRIFDEPVAALLIAAAVEGTCAVFYATAELTSVPRVVQHQLLPIAIARNEARSQGALSMGRPLGGFLAAIGHYGPSLINLVAGLAALLSVLRMDGRFFRANKPYDTGMINALKVGLSAFWKERFLRAVMFVCIVTNVLFQIVILLFIVLAKQEQRSTLFIGVILAASGIGGLIGAFSARRLIDVNEKLSVRIAPKLSVDIAVKRKLSVLVACSGAWLVLTAIIAFTHHPVAMVIAWGGIGFVGANVNVALNLYQAREIKQHLLARVASASNFISRCSAAAGALCAGYIVSAFGPTRSAEVVFFMMLGLTISVFVLAAGISRQHQATEAKRSRASRLDEPTHATVGHSGDNGQDELSEQDRRYAYPGVPA